MTSRIPRRSSRSASRPATPRAPRPGRPSARRISISARRTISVPSESSGQPPGAGREGAGLGHRAARDPLLGEEPPSA